MKTILVLGGTSWVGGRIAHEAVVRGHDVTCLARGVSGDAPSAATFVRADRERPHAYDQVLDRRWDVVIDVSRQPGQVSSAVDALGGVTSHWILVSTGSVYADQSGALFEDSPLLEALADDVAGPDRYGEGKVACEETVSALSHHLIVRAGLIGGPGDRSDRLGDYAARCAVADAEPVLIPDVADQPMQVIDVRDLAQWIVHLAEEAATGVVHGVGEPTTVGELIDVSTEVSGFRGELIGASVSWLRAHDVEEWMGPRSLPLWLPASHHGMGLMDDSRARELGLRRRPLPETMRDVLSFERDRGLDRARAAGLDRTDEIALLAELAAGQ